MACGYEEERGRVLKIRSCGECGEDPELKRLQIAESFGGLKALRSLPEAKLGSLRKQNIAFLQLLKSHRFFAEFGAGITAPFKQRFSAALMPSYWRVRDRLGGG